MNKILIITVGGSCEPIVTAVSRIKADKVYFICSADSENGKNDGSYKTVIGEGLVCGPRQSPNKSNIVSQCNLKKETYEVIKLKEYDDYNYCYSKCLNLISELYDEGNNPEIIVDYTGGTKSMSAGILLAATEYPDVVVSIVKGDRDDLVKVKDGTERVKSTRTNIPFLNSIKKQVIKLIELFDYASAMELTKDALNIPDLNNKHENHFLELRDFCSCLNDWDNFNHNDALELLKQKKCLPKKFETQLQNVVNSRRCLEEGKPIPPRKGFSRYEVLFDLLENAKRKAIQEKYDDAVGRLYRVTELLAQAYLKFEYKIDTSNVIVSELPEEAKNYYYEKYKNRETIELPLLESYRLISKLNKSSEISKIFENQENRIMRGLEVRNYSILAHGFNPVDESRYNEVYDILIENFVTPILEELIKDYQSEYYQLPNYHAPQSL